MADAERCVGCGEIIAEGSQVCQTCLHGASYTLVQQAMDELDTVQKVIQRVRSKLTLAAGGKLNG